MMNDEGLHASVNFLALSILQLLIENIQKCTKCFKNSLEKEVL